MSHRKPLTPPRPLAAGDLVAAPSRELGEWTAAQVIRVDAGSRTVALLELDWSGPEPESAADLGDVAPLRLTHHSWNGTPAYCNHSWVLPRSHKVVGAMPLLHDQPSNRWTPGWRLGDQLARQRRWDSGIHEDPATPWEAEYTGQALDELLGEPAAPRAEVTRLTVRNIDTLDCARLVERFPELTRLDLYGRLGLLSAAGELNRLASLREIRVVELFGMTGEDCLLPQRVPEMESVDLYGVPADYASAMRRAWRPEVPAGTYVSILRARKPEWVVENRNNPLRDWDGREQISSRTYKSAVAHYKSTRKAALQVFAEEPAASRPARLEEIGRAYGEAFNELDDRAGFIETVEREELFEALDHLVDEAEALHGTAFAQARESLYSGVESVRDW